MDDGRKDLVYGQLAEGKLPVGGPKLCKGVCKRNIKIHRTGRREVGSTG